MSYPTKLSLIYTSIWSRVPCNPLHLCYLTTPHHFPPVSIPTFLPRPPPCTLVQLPGQKSRRYKGSHYYYYRNEAPSPSHRLHLKRFPPSSRIAAGVLPLLLLSPLPPTATLTHASQLEATTIKGAWQSLVFPFPIPRSLGGEDRSTKRPLSTVSPAWTGGRQPSRRVYRPIGGGVMSDAPG